MLFVLCRFVSESFLTGASSTQLSTKLLSLLQDCICTHLFPELTKRLERLKYAVTPAARTLLKKGRRYAQLSGNLGTLQLLLCTTVRKYRHPSAVALKLGRSLCVGCHPTMTKIGMHLVWGTSKLRLLWQGLPGFRQGMWGDSQCWFKAKGSAYKVCMSARHH